MKFLKNLFSVPKGKKVTDADMKRVLVSSVCGILVCMTCLISSTWAWYTVSAETAPFAIEVADLKLTLTVNDAKLEKTSLELAPAQATTVQVKFSPAQTADSLNVTAKRYIVMTVLAEQEQPVGTYYIACTGNVTEVALVTDVACEVFFTPAWQIPLNGKEFPAESFKLVEAPTEPTTTAPAETTVPATTEPKATEPKATETADATPVATTAPAGQGNEFFD